MKTAIGAYEKVPFKVENEEVALIVMEFGSRKPLSKIVWTVRASPPAQMHQAVDHCRAHIEKTKLEGWTSQVTMAAKLEREVETGAWALLFQNHLDSSSSK